MDRYVTTDEVARRLNVKVETVRRWVRQGKLQGLPLGRAGYRITEEDYAAFAHQHTSPLHKPDALMSVTPSIVDIPFLPLLETITDSFVILDRQWRFRYLNDAACQILACTRSEMFEQIIWQTYPILIGSPFDFALKEAATSGRAIPCEYISPITGRWQLAQIYPSSAWISIYTTDVTERKEKEQRFRATFEHAAVGIAHVELDGHWRFVNQRICDLLGYSQQELLGRTFQDITYPDDLETDFTYRQQLLSGERQSYMREKRYICYDGSLLWINLMVSLVRATDGTPLYYITVVEDINERKRLEILRDKFLTLANLELGSTALSPQDIPSQLKGDGIIPDDTSPFSYLEHLEARLNRQTQIIENLLDLNQGDA